MPEKNFRAQEKHTPAIWAVALALTLAMFLSLVWLAPVVWDISETSKNIIPLFYTGDRQIVTQNTLQYLAGEEKPGVVVQDQDAVWEIETDVDLFSSSYVGEDGTVTVESSNGDKVIAPGTSQEYRFSLKNTGNISLDYTMALSGLFTLQDMSLPIKIRLRKGGEWIVGNENEWKKPETINDVIEKGTLDVNHSVEYTFEWLWPFEDDREDTLILNDLYDSIAANAAVAEDVNFRLGISTVSIVTPGAIPVDENGTPMLEPLIRWNLISHLVIPCAILLMTAPFILAAHIPVEVSGKAPLFAGETLRFGRRSCKIDGEGRYSLKKIPMGKLSISIGKSHAVVRIKRKRNVEGIVFDSDKKGQILRIGYNIRGLELSFWRNGDQLMISDNRFTATDSKNRVHTP